MVAILSSQFYLDSILEIWSEGFLLNFGIVNPLEFLLLGNFQDVGFTFFIL